MRDEHVWTNEEVYDKIDWEGGLAEALDWGLTRQLMNDRVTDRLVFAAKEALKTFRCYQLKLENHLETSIDTGKSCLCGKSNGNQYAERVCILGKGHEGDCFF